MHARNPTPDRGAREACRLLSPVSCLLPAVLPIKKKGRGARGPALEVRRSDSGQCARTVAGEPKNRGLRCQRRSLDQTPGLAIGEERAAELGVHGVTGTMRHDVSHDRVADQRQVADHIQNLVADELVLEAERVEGAGVADDDRVLERAAERQSLLPQPLHFLQEAERARRGDVLGEALFRDPLGPRLVAQQRMIEADRVAHLEVVRRIDRDALVAARNLERLEDLQILARRRPAASRRLPAAGTGTARCCRP